MTPQDPEAACERLETAIGPVAWVIDDVSFPKDGEEPPGVAAQYCGASGKNAQKLRRNARASAVQKQVVGAVAAGPLGGDTGRARHRVTGVGGQCLMSSTSSADRIRRRPVPPVLAGMLQRASDMSGEM